VKTPQAKLADSGRLVANDDGSREAVVKRAMVAIDKSESKTKTRQSEGEEISKRPLD
jgi:hypothetical protein